MRVALAVGANPRSYESTSEAFVYPGKWKVVTEDVTDSQILVKNHTLSLSPHDTFVTASPLGFLLEFIKRGTERRISVFLETV
jgi:hypothetical protein